VEHVQSARSSACCRILYVEVCVISVKHSARARRRREERGEKRERARGRESERGRIKEPRVYV
jgi:hypothetical protein